LENNGDISFYEDTGTTAKFFWDASQEALGIGTTSPVGKIQTDIGTPTVIGLKATSGLNITNNGGGVGYIYQIGFGYQTGTTYLPAAIYALTTSNAGYNTNDICFATRSVTTDTAPLERMRIDSNGNVGIGVVPEAWDSAFSALQVGGTGALRSDAGAGSGDTVGVSQNAYYDSNNGRWEYLVTDEASDYYQQSGSHYWRVAPSGSADAAITWTSAMVINNSGNVGIGTSSPATKLDVLGDNLVGTFAGTDTASAYISFKYNTSTLSAFIGNGSSVLSGANNSDFIIRSQGDLVFASNGNNRRVTIDTSGNLMMGKTSISNAVGGIRFSPAQEMIIGRDGTSAHDMIDFYRGVSGSLGRVGNIRTQDSSTSYNTSSDYRLKENVNYTFDATTRLKQLRPARFNFIVNADVTVDGFLAHEVQSVVPEAITGTYNEVDADGNPVYQGIDQSKLVPLLVKTIQELEARITALENGE